MKRILLLASVMLMVVGVALGQSKIDGKSQIAENWIAAWNSHDVEKVIPLFTKDVLYEDVTFAAVNHGTEELRKFATGFLEAVPDLKMELVGSSIQGNQGSIEWILRGTDKGIYKTGQKFSVRGVSIVNLEHGRISRNLDFYDSATIMRQVGLLPAAKN